MFMQSAGVGSLEQGIILNDGGRWSGGGDAGAAMADVRFDPNLMRPFFDEKRRACILVNTGRTDKDQKPILQKMTINDAQAAGIPVLNATSLRKDEWIRLDQAVLKVARERLRAWTDLAASNTFGGFDGMSKLILEHETMSDPGEANVDFDALTEGRRDSPLFQLEGLPLPITHCHYWFSKRRLAVSRNTNTPLDTTMAEAAARRVAEKIEQTLIGTVTGLTYGTVADYGRAPTVYGYTNFGPRLTKTDVPTPTGSNATAIVGAVLDALDDLAAQNFFGPFMLYHSNDWDRYLDDDYVASGGNNPNTTLRNRLRQIDRITDVRRLDFLSSSSNPFTLLFVQMTSDVARAVIGMNMTTVQWESMGGMRLDFKVMAIMVPQLRADYNDQCGILHATTS